MLDRVGIPDPDRQIKEYPHQFSGGMRQRIMIAMALLSNPALLVADEPTSALDVTLEAQILELICGLRDELGTAILYITHDLGVIARLCDRVQVMYAGNVVESGDVYTIFDQPQHPYTQALLHSHPAHSGRADRLRTIRGRVPSLRSCQPAASSPRAVTLSLRCVTPQSQKPTRPTTIRCCATPTDLPGRARHRPLTPPAPAALQVDEDRDAASASEEVLVVTNQVRTHFKDHVGLAGPDPGPERRCGAGRGRRGHRDPSGRDPGPGRRVGFGQDHAGPDDPAPGGSHGRRYPHRGPGHHQPVPTRRSGPCAPACR